MSPILENGEKLVTLQKILAHHKENLIRRDRSLLGRDAIRALTSILFELKTCTEL